MCSGVQQINRLPQGFDFLDSISSAVLPQPNCPYEKNTKVYCSGRLSGRLVGFSGGSRIFVKGGRTPKRVRGYAPPENFEMLTA